MSNQENMKILSTIAFDKLKTQIETGALASNLKYRDKNVVVTGIIRQITDAKAIVTQRESGISANRHQYTLR